MKTPVLILCFNRPDLLKALLQQLRQIKPEVLYVSRDGPRPGNEKDVQLCSEVQKILSEMIDWDCKMSMRLLEANLGCREGVSSGISWFFDHENEGIILEDDCIPNAAFFDYCEKMLNAYRSSEEVFHISGTGLIPDGWPAASYFSKYAPVWGWATWKRAWSFYDNHLEKEKDVEIKNVIKNNFTGENQIQYWEKQILKTRDRSIDSWAYVWNYSIWRKNGVALIPTGNFIINRGIGPDATHTVRVDASSDWPKSAYIDNKISPLVPLPFASQIRDELIFDRIIQRKDHKTSIWSRLFSRKERHKMHFDSRLVASMQAEIQEREIYKFIDPHPLVILDIGANIGVSAKYFGGSHPDCLVYCFEPDPDIFLILLETIRKENLLNVVAVNAAVSSTSGKRIFFKQGGLSGSLRNLGAISSKEEIETCPLSNLTRLDNTYFLKIDIEGAEHELINLLPASLTKTKYFFLEYHFFKDEPQLLDVLLRILSDADFRYYIESAAIAKNPFVSFRKILNFDGQINIFSVKK